MGVTSSSEKPVRIVLADDHSMMREMLASLLNERDGLEIVGEAADGAEAVELAAREAPDLVLLNFRMPRMNGAEAAQEIRRRWPHIAVVGLSADSADGDVPPQMKAAGADTFVSKDAGVDAIVAAIQNLSAGARRCPSDMS